MDTKKLRQKILDLAIRGKLVPQDPNDEPASVLLERIKAEKERLIKEGKIKRSKKSASDTSHYKNVPFEIPKSWVWTTIEEVTPSLQYGTSEKSKSSGDIAVLRMGNITRKGTIDYSDLVYTSNKADIEKLRLKAGDILFNRTNSSEWVGKTAIYRGEVPSIYAGYIIRMTPIFLDCEYVNMVMNSQYERDWCNFVKTDGVNQSNINSQKLGQFYIPIPPIEEQKRIVETGNYWLHLVESIESNKKDIINTITKAKQEVLRKAICGELVSQDPTDEPAIELLKRIKSNIEIPCDNPHYQKLPNGWAMTSMQNICQIRDGEKRSDIPRINLDVKYLRGKSEGEMVSSGKYVPSGSTMILVDGENSGEIFTSVIDGYQGSTFKLLNVSSEMNMGFVLLVIKSHQQEFRENKVGSAIPHLNKKLFKEIAVMIPPIEEQQRIVKSTQQYLNLLECISGKL